MCQMALSTNRTCMRSIVKIYATTFHFKQFFGAVAEKLHAENCQIVNS